MMFIKLKLSKKNLLKQNEQSTSNFCSSFIPIFLSLVMTLGSVVSTNVGQMADVIAIKEGADLDLDCPIVLRNEDMIFSWTCDNEPANIRSSRIHVTDSGKLRIRSAKVGDSCNYRCEVADGFGTLSVIIKVIIVDRKLLEHFSRPNQTLESKLKGNSKHQQELVRKTSIRELVKEKGLLASHVENIKTGFEDKQQPELEIQVEPAAIHVNKNQTFSLECRVKHAPHLNTPQIIWLKEFIGRKPDSINEAHEQNLVVIDDVYYHSLNWPRSITYSPNSACVSSALLVRQTNFVHSGRYICFAGYPPYTMVSNLSSASTSSSGSNHLGLLKYKMAVAVVGVNDPDQEWLDLEHQPKNLLINVISSNSWARNSTIVILLICVISYAIKVIYRRYKLEFKKNNQTIETDNINAISNDPENSLAIKQLNLCHQQLLLQPSNSASVSTKSIQGSKQVISEESEKGFGGQDENDHVYSEISSNRFRMASLDDANYKIPTIRNGNHNEK